MLYLEIDNTFTPWSGEPINDARHPLSIEQVWSDEDLAAIGLYKPTDADPVPEGKVIASTSVERVNGVVKYVNTLEDAPPPPVPESVTPAQARVALLNAGLLASVKSAVDQADDETQIWFEFALEWRRDNPVLAQLGTTLGLSEGQIDNLFRAAAEIAA
jgi:hypothetical protein